jgi:tetratricopeptide (TPR) repeat protein
MQSHIQHLKQLGLQAFERRDYATALDQFRTILASEPSFADVRHYAGLCLIFLDQPDEALAQIEGAIATNPAYVEAHINRALLLQEMGRYDEAGESFVQAADHEQHNHDRFPAAVTARLANAHAGVGDLYYDSGAYDEAAREYGIALDLRPRFHDIRNKFASCLLGLDRAGEARAELDRILEWNPDFIAARLNRGLALHRLGERDAAAADWRECARQQPDHPQVRAYLAMLDRLVAEDIEGVKGGTAADDAESADA